MAVQTPTFRNNLTADTNRRPSPAIWADCPPKQVIDEIGGSYVFDDFTLAAPGIYTSNAAGIGPWTSWGATGTLFADGAAEGGVIKIGSDGDDEQVAFLSVTSSFRFITTSTLANNGKMWFEARFARSSVTTDVADYFVGLMAPTLTSGLPVTAQPITATDDTLMTAGSLFGFHSNSNTATRGGPTEIALAFVLASGTVNYPTNMTTLMASSGNSVLTAGGFVKVGFVFDPQAYSKAITSATARQTAGQVVRPLIRVFVNNLEVPAFLSSADVNNATSGQAFPTSFMAPCFAIGNTSAGSPTLNMDWIKCVQMPNS